MTKTVSCRRPPPHYSRLATHAHLCRYTYSNMHLLVWPATTVPLSAYRATRSLMGRS